MQKDLSCIDGIDGGYTDKRRFLISDYCGNFEYFREHQNGYESTETKSLTENIFYKQTRLIFAMQDSNYAVDAEYQDFRSELVTLCNHEVCGFIV